MTPIDKELYSFSPLDVLQLHDVVDDCWSMEEARMHASLQLSCAPEMFKKASVSVYRLAFDAFDDFEINRKDANNEIRKLAIGMTAARVARQIFKQ